MAATFPAGTAQQMLGLVKSADDVVELKRIQAILFGAYGMSAQEVSVFVGYNEHYIRHLWSLFRAEGTSSLKSEKGIGNRNRAHISWEEEKNFLEPFFNEAGKGGVLIVRAIHLAYEHQFQKKVYPTVIYNLLHRHGWRKIAPRPSHPKGNKELQEAFKASFPPECKGGIRRGKPIGETFQTYVSG